VIFAGFAAIFALGFIFLCKRPQFAPERIGANGEGAEGGRSDARASATANRTQVGVARKNGLAPGTAESRVADGPDSAHPERIVPPPPTAATSLAVEEAQRHVAGSLDELKDKLFRLELRKQAGTISDDDYSRERLRIEQLLRDLVRG
jgi:hypothetical protein